jgi:hypothetical protein
MAIAEAQALLHENKHITELSNSYLALFLLNETMKFRQREKAADYAALVENLDSASLHEFGLYHKIKRTMSLRPYGEGDTIEGLDMVVDALGDSISLADLVNAEGYVFLFLWHRSCPHCIRLIDLINSDLESQMLYKDKIVAINNEVNLSHDEMSHIQSEAGFNCYFHDENISNDLIDKFWVKFSPFGVILEDGKIVRLAYHFDDFIELIK